MQESTVVASTVHKLFLNFITRPRFPFDGSTYFSPEGNQIGVLQRVGSVAGIWFCLLHIFLEDSCVNLFAYTVVHIVRK